MLLPIRLVRTISGCWHWDYQHQLRIRCHVHTSPLRKPIEHQIWREIPNMQTLGVILRGLYVPKCYGQGPMVVKADNERFPRIEGKLFCTMCLSFLVEQYLAQPCLALNEEIPVKFDLTKPLIVCSDGTIVQAEGKTIMAAKELAKEIIRDEDVTATIFKPHTRLHRELPPITETKLG